jgi:soluble lytic murein transglycosylase-like protein
MDSRDAEQNIEGGAHYLKDLLAMFNSNLRLAVAGYNAGEGAVMKYNNTVPPYPETQNYVQQVLALYGKG